VTRLSRRTDAGGYFRGPCFDRLPGVAIFELRWVQVAEHRVEPPSVVDVFKAARKIGSDVREGFVVRQVDGLDLQHLDAALGLVRMDPCSGYYILTGMGVPIHTTQTRISRSGALPSQPCRYSRPRVRSIRSVRELCRWTDYSN
jgi:hypothetical protein